MGVFSFMETFFFISLGITFVMIIMLVYHFKQRMIVLERKHDTMFDIVNNIVKQIKNMQVNISYLGENQYIGGHGLHGIHHMNMNDNIIPFANGLPPIKMHEFNMKFNDMSEVIVKGHDAEVAEDDEDDDDEDDDEDEDEDHDEDDDEDEDEDHDEDEDEDHDEDDDEDDDDEDEDDEDHDTSNIKVINVEINEVDTTNLGILDIAQVAEITDVNSTTLEQNMEINDDEIIIRKIEKPIVDENASTEMTETTDTSKDNKDIYKKMSLSVLKATVIEKGLSSDPSKLKKHELIKLLESVDSI